MWKVSPGSSANGSPPVSVRRETRTPLVEPRSWIVTGGPRRSTACRRDNVG